MKVFGFVGIISMAFVTSTSLSAQEGQIQLVRACVTQTLQRIQTDSMREVVASGGVTCPAGDVVGFPPRSRKHDRTGSIVVLAGQGRMICEGTIPNIRNESSNNGSRGKFTFDESRDRISMPISCRGASIGNGRRWYNAELVAKSCIRITDDMLLDVTLECAAQLN